MISQFFQRLSNFFIGKGFECVISKKELWIIILMSALFGVFSAYALPMHIPEQSGHRFRHYPDSHSAINRTLILR